MNARILIRDTLINDVFIALHAFNVRSKVLRFLRISRCSYIPRSESFLLVTRSMSSSSTQPETGSDKQPSPKAPSASVPALSKKYQLKQAVKDYGLTVVVFHVAISLASLGGFYTAVSRYGQYKFISEIEGLKNWLVAFIIGFLVLLT